MQRLVRPLFVEPYPLRPPRPPPPDSLLSTAPSEPDPIGITNKAVISTHLALIRTDLKRCGSCSAHELLYSCIARRAVLPHALHHFCERARPSVCTGTDTSRPCKGVCTIECGLQSLLLSRVDGDYAFETNMAVTALRCRIHEGIDACVIVS